MGVRRQIYLDEQDNRLLEAESRSTGVSASELVRRAIQECYGAGRRLDWTEVFGTGLQAGSATVDPWTYDDLFDNGALFDEPSGSA